MGIHAGMISLFVMYVGEKFLRRPVGIYMLSTYLCLCVSSAAAETRRLNSSRSILSWLVGWLAGWLLSSDLQEVLWGVLAAE